MSSIATPPYFKFGSEFNIHVKYSIFVPKSQLLNWHYDNSINAQVPLSKALSIWVKSVNLIKIHYQIGV